MNEYELYIIAKANRKSSTIIRNIESDIQEFINAINSEMEKQKMQLYTTAELELIDELYDSEFTYKAIAEECNNQFHDGKIVRTEKSIDYALNKIYNDPRCLDLD